MEKPNNIDEYIASFPKETQFILELVRTTIKKAAPAAEERISYGMPAFRYKNSNLVYFAGYKNHIGLYPAPAGMETFKKEFTKYKTGKGSVQFPINEPMPIKLIEKIVKFRVSLCDSKLK